MTVSSELNKHVYTGNGVTTSFSFTFYVLDEDDLHLYLTRISTGVTTEITTNFTVSPTDGSFPASSGTITYPTSGTAISSDYKLTIIREMDVLQETVYPNNSSLRPKVVEQSLDRITMIAQQNKELLDRSLTADVSATTTYTLPAALADAGIGWNSAGTALENKSSPGELLSVPDVTAAIAHSVGTGSPHTAAGVGALPITGGTMTGVLVEKKGADIASAATINLSTATGNLIHVTGTTPITAVTMTSGQRMTVIFDGILTLIHHATNNNLPGGANITTAAGDCAEYWYDGTTVKCTNYQKTNGNSVTETTGNVVQVVSSESGAVATGTTVIPLDDTIPQKTEGDEYFTLAITPKSATNILIIDVSLNVACSAAAWVIAALFQDTTANALAATWGGKVENTNDPTAIYLRHKMVAGTTSATTFKVRCGPHTAATVTLNGHSGGRMFGGVMASSITITEVKA
jgi:hypothetical protein